MLSCSSFDLLCLGVTLPIFCRPLSPGAGLGVVDGHTCPVQAGLR